VLKLNFITIFVLCLFNHVVYSQIVMDTTLPVNELVEKVLLGNGVRVGNISFSGNKMQIAKFTATATPIDFTTGIVLSSGSIANIPGPNTYPYTTTAYGNLATQKKLKGDKDLNKIAHNYTYDMAILEFDFIATENKVAFTYAFGSEEYPEYVDSRYNDVFGFFITGPKYRSKNIATLPLSITPITVNSINHHENKKGYIDNDFFSDITLVKQLPGAKKDKDKKKAENSSNKFDIDFKINAKKKKKLNPQLINHLQYDGMTKALVAWCYVEPYQKYHIKIAIADVGDNSYDSGVFLQANTFGSSLDDKKLGYKKYSDRSSTFNYDSLFYGYPPKKNMPVAIVSKQDSIAEAEEARFQITNINFDSDSYVLPDSAQINLEALVNYMRKERRFKCELFGYTDNQGNKEYNQKLSDNRASNVMNFMIARGITKERIKISGFNFERPLAENDSETGRSRNRRVEIVLDEDKAWIANQIKLKAAKAAQQAAAKPTSNTTSKKKK
jgi:outer membrane protein OmpA-like peptidoglycan-associated protein